MKPRKILAWYASCGKKPSVVSQPRVFRLGRNSKTLDIGNVKDLQAVIMAEFRVANSKDARLCLFESEEKDARTISLYSIISEQCQYGLTDEKPICVRISSRMYMFPTTV